MEPSSSAVGAAATSLLSVLADGGGRTAALSLLHQRALQTTGGTCSLLFEQHPTTGHMLATSGAGLEALPLEPWSAGSHDATIVAQAFADRRTLAIADLQSRMPSLHAQVGAAHALLLPLATEGRRLGLVVIGLAGNPEGAAAALDSTDIPGGFVIAIELTRLRQREEFERDTREVLDGFAERLATTLDVVRALEPLCEEVTRLFAADRTTVWLHDRDTRSLSPLASSEPGFPERVGSIRADDPIAPAAAALRTPRAGLASVRTEATSVLTVPLKGCRRALGCVVFEGVRIEPGADIALLNRADELGRQLSSAIEATQLLSGVLQSRRELEQIFASLVHLVAVVDADGRIARVNPAFARAAGRAPESLVSQPLADCVGPELVAWLAALPQPLASAGVCEISDSVLRGPYIVTVTELAAAAGQHAGRVIVARDVVPGVAVHEHDELRSRLVQSEKLAALGQFVAGVAHELNNPLQSVLGNLDFLRATGAVPDAIRDEIRTVQRDAERAATIVRNLLVFTGSGRLQRRKTSVNTVLHKVLRQRHSSWRSRRIELVRHYDQRLPRIQADPLLLEQVFLHIVMNAEQAVAATGGPGRIEVGTKAGAESGWVVVSIRDTGAGLTDDPLPRVFDPFYTTRDVGQGTGLGLALAYGIVQEHGGRISAGNHPGGGAVFTVELPIA